MLVHSLAIIRLLSEIVKTLSERSLVLEVEVKFLLPYDNFWLFIVNYKKTVAINYRVVKGFMSIKSTVRDLVPDEGFRKRRIQIAGINKDALDLSEW
jgi:hypothetical protein